MFADLPKYTDMTMSTVTQRQSVFYSGTFPLLRFVVSQLAGDVHLVDDRDGSEKRVYHKNKQKNLMSIVSQSRL
jgi:hypothetical protein